MKRVDGHALTSSAMKVAVTVTSKGAHTSYLLGIHNNLLWRAQNVFLDHSTYAPPPSRFEPGTPPIAEAIGAGAAADYISGLGMQRIADYEHELGGYLWQQARQHSRLHRLRVHHEDHPVGMKREAQWDAQRSNSTGIIVVTP